MFAVSRIKKKEVAKRKAVEVLEGAAVDADDPAGTSGALAAARASKTPKTAADGQSGKKNAREGQSAIERMRVGGDGEGMASALRSGAL